LFMEHRRSGRLEPESTSTRKQLGQLRTMRQLAKATDTELSTWPTPNRSEK
jgi:hypothetical protein